MIFFVSLTMLLKVLICIHKFYCLLSLLPGVCLNSLTKHFNDFVEVSSAFIQSWLQFHLFFFLNSLYFTGKGFAEEDKNTTDPYHAFITSWNFAPTFDSEHTLNHILWAGSSDPFGEGWSACTHRPTFTNRFFSLQSRPFIVYKS